VGQRCVAHMSHVTHCNAVAHVSHVTHCNAVVHMQVGHTLQHCLHLRVMSHTATLCGTYQSCHTLQHCVWHLVKSYTATLCCTHDSCHTLQLCNTHMSFVTNRHAVLQLRVIYHTLQYRVAHMRHTRDHFTNKACHTRRIYIHHFTAHQFTAHHHILQRCVAYMDESCHTYEWVMLYAYIWMSHVTHLTTLLHTVARCNTVLHIFMSHITHMNTGLFFTEYRVFLIE